MKTFIPFSGFYESLWIAALDSEEESLADHLATDCEDFDGFSFLQFDTDDVREAMYSHLNYTGAAWSAMAKAWVEYFAEETSLHVRYTTTISPKEYNFTTDRIECDISRSTVRYMRATVNAASLDRVAAERHTSRSGFHSYYSPDVTTWGRVDNWDANQVETLLIAYLGEDMPSEEDCIEQLSGNGFFSNITDAAIDAAAMHATLTGESK